MSVRVRVTFECELDNKLWGIDEMEEDGVLTEDYIQEMIKEDLTGVIEDCDLKIEIERA